MGDALGSTQGAAANTLGYWLDANKEVAGEEYNTGAHKGPATRLEGEDMEAPVTPSCYKLVLLP